ncbi:hypothetical protein B9N60_10155 [Campylobacter concisus]|uniref:Uncharacterized protein n=1 Tax=Campylobacter concisus TaxID=199 RepID=A0A1Y5N5G6_9BACT|nr:hypothetical protein [Campylobacter concisus]OUT15739.1 hypothetical protein B9N60_10155 [Campylobacter concisus]
MKFVKLVFLFLVVSLNLYGFEPMMPGRAYEKASDDYGQVDTIVWCSADYGVDTITPSFKCYDDKDKYKFKEYSLEDFICQSRSTAFRDNYFADLYNLILKEAPNLKEKAQKIARERITKTQKECIAPRSKKFKQNCKLTFSISGAVLCSRSYYRSYTAKLALMLYESDKELFSRIYGEDYEKFKEVFEDTLKYVPILYSEVELNGIKKTDDKLYAEFLRKYDDYTGDYDNYKIHDLIYIVLVQYSLIDKNGHLVLPENRKEE